MTSFVTPKPRETFPSFLGRVAASRGVSVLEYTRDLGVQFRNILELPDVMREGLLKWANLSVPQMDEMLSWTGIRSGDIKITYRGETFGSRSLRSPTVRGCPVCLRQDMSVDGTAAELMALRGHWQFRDCVTCIEHGHLLVPLWSHDIVKVRLDSAAQFQQLAQRIQSQELDMPRIALAPYDHWLEARLMGQKDQNWIDEFSIDTVTTVSRLLGAKIIGHSLTDLKQDVGLLRTALVAGFSTLQAGPDGFRAALEQLAAGKASAAGELRSVYGDLYTRLGHDLGGQPSFDPFRDIMRAVIMGSWPFPEGEVILGTRFEKRYTHSVTTAAVQVNIRADKMAALLVEAGAIEADDPRPLGRQLFSAEKFAPFLEDVANLVGQSAMRQAIGATRKEFEILVREGLLRPRTQIKELRQPWLIRDGQEFVEKLYDIAVPGVDPADDAWARLVSITVSKRVTLSNLVGAALSGAIQIGLIEGEVGFHAIRALTASVDKWIAEVRLNTEEGQLMAASLSLAEFGRAVGIREMSDLTALISLGIISATEVVNPLSRKRQWRVKKDDIRDFRAKFTTVGMLAEETGQSPNVVGAAIRRAKIAPYSVQNVTFRNLWPRERLMELKY
ncbi:TniQ family protein [Falsigemmobacter intermedius]|uniref:TniQ family protein n=1 Tax=Falsigemmobacter intermedius TaxID=1553448 RepID=UPI0013E2CA38|nr:TniQ family protein [Falsigemmobacter intermedius]